MSLPSKPVDIYEKALRIQKIRFLLARDEGDLIGNAEDAAREADGLLCLEASLTPEERIELVQVFREALRRGASGAVCHAGLCLIRMRDLPTASQDDLISILHEALPVYAGQAMETAFAVLLRNPPAGEAQRQSLLTLFEKGRAHDPMVASLYTGAALLYLKLDPPQQAEFLTRIAQGLQDADEECRHKYGESVVRLGRLPVTRIKPDPALVEEISVLYARACADGRLEITRYTCCMQTPHHTIFDDRVEDPARLKKLCKSCGINAPRPF